MNCCRLVKHNCYEIPEHNIGHILICGGLISIMESKIKFRRQIRMLVVFRMRYSLIQYVQDIKERSDCCAYFILKKRELRIYDDCCEISGRNDPSQSMNWTSYSHIVFLHGDT